MCKFQTFWLYCFNKLFLSVQNIAFKITIFTTLNNFTLHLISTNTMSLDLSKIIKRLELIKSLIFLEEEDEINTHSKKLNQFLPNLNLQNIITFLDRKSYGQAIHEIEEFVNQYTQVTFYIDPELEALKLEAKVLEKEVNGLSDEMADLEKMIREFDIRHNSELGELILKILQYRIKQAKDTPKQAEAEKDYNDYSQEYEISKNERIAELAEDELKELKQKYRRASKLCHPDVVSEEQKELADKLFTELNVAYQRNDLKRVREILENLERGDFFVSKSDAISEKQLLKTEIEKLRLRIKELKDQVQVIKESEAFTTVSNINDWDTYFKEIKQKLAEQIKELEDGRE